MLTTGTVAASNFPDHRGTATAFPLAAFGLSAFFWSTISSLIFHDDTGRFLLLLALGTFFLTIVSIPFLRIIPHNDPYHPLSPQSSRVETRQLHRSKSSEHSLHAGASDEPGTQSSTLEPQPQARGRSLSSVSNSQSPSVYNNPDVSEASSLVRSSRESVHESRPNHNTDEDHDDALSDVSIDLPHPDIRGLAMLAKVEFWQLFLAMTLLSGLGLMTIK